MTALTWTTHQPTLGPSTEVGQLGKARIATINRMIGARGETPKYSAVFTLTLEIRKAASKDELKAWCRDRLDAWLADAGLPLP